MENMEQIVMKLNKFHLLLSFLITAFILEFNVITFRTILANHHEHEPNLFGFPFIYKTSVPWVNSFEQNVYLLGLLENMVVGCVFFYVFIGQINKLRFPKIIKKSTNFIIMAMGIMALLSFFLSPFEDKTFEWNHSFDLKNSQKEIEFFSTTNEKQ